VPAHWLLASVHGAKNAVYVQSYALGASMYYGAGAGMLPTAMSVVSDCLELGRTILARAAGVATRARPRAHVGRQLLPLDDIRSKYYLRFGVADEPGVLGRLMTILGAHRVSIAQVVQDAAVGSGASVIVVTHEAREGDMRAALAEIEALEFMRERPNIIRIAG
jgi:homoserine dehydrogenase